MTSDPLATFTAAPSPVNALALAISDHKAFAGSGTHWAYVDALNRAKDQCAAYPGLLDACKAALALLRNPDAEPADADRVDTILEAALIVSKP